MAGLGRLWPGSVVVAVLVVAAGGTLVALSESGGMIPLVVSPSATPAETPAPTLQATPSVPVAPRSILYQSNQDGRLFAYAVAGSSPEDLILIETLAGLSGTHGHVIVWRADGAMRTQVFEAARQDRQPNAGFGAADSAVIYGVQQTTDGVRELAIVYDATAYGSGSPTAGVVVLRLEDGDWRILWDSWLDADEWQGYHGSVEFVNGGIDALQVRGDIWGDVLFEANAGPHQRFVDRWEREGDRYVRATSEIVPSPYATLVQFLKALGSGDGATARDLVTDPGLVERARSLGLDGALGKNWGIDCDDWDTCLQAGPIGFDPLRTRGEPTADVFFEKEDSRWLIADIREDQQP